MLFVGEELREMINQTQNPIELRNEHGRCCRMLSSAEALVLDLDLFVGIGNWDRIKAVRSRATRIVPNAGSRTTQRLKGEGEVNIAHPLIREHRRVPVRPAITSTRKTRR